MHLDKAILDSCADIASYVGSPEHKTFPSFAGRMQGRSDATKCPTRLKDQATINTWLTEAIRAGNVSEEFEGDFPRYVWGRPDGEDVCYEARVTNGVLGQYKGYPLAEAEEPEGLR